MKSYHFISGLPRSGSTLLSAILKQNPQFYADIGNPLIEIVDSAINVITESNNNFVISEEQRKNLIYGIFDSYYQHIDNSVIFDSSRGWTKRTTLIKELFPQSKILCPVRDIVSIMNSFELISSKNPFYSNSLPKENDNVYTRCDSLMDKNGGKISSPLISLEEGYFLNRKMIMIIEYENLCRHPEKVMRDVYDFLEMPYYNHNFDNVEYTNLNFDRSINLNGLHTVRKKVKYDPPKCILPPNIVKKYNQMGLEFWKDCDDKVNKKYNFV